MSHEWDGGYTENLADFGFREIKLAREIFDAWVDHGLPEDFDSDGAKLALNGNSGFVFLVNSEYQTAMMNGTRLESFYATPYEGHEGFADELADEYEDMHPEDQQYCRDVGIVDAVTA